MSIGPNPYRGAADWTNIVAVLIIAAIIAGILGVVNYVMPRIACHQEWKDSGLDARYSLMQGCMIKTKDGGWVNQKYYRAPDK